MKRPWMGKIALLLAVILFLLHGVAWAEEEPWYRRVMSRFFKKAKPPVEDKIPAVKEPLKEPVGEPKTGGGGGGAPGATPLPPVRAPDVGSYRPPRAPELPTPDMVRPAIPRAPAPPPRPVTIPQPAPVTVPRAQDIAPPVPRAPQPVQATKPPSRPPIPRRPGE